MELDMYVVTQVILEEETFIKGYHCYKFEWYVVQVHVKENVTSLIPFEIAFLYIVFVCVLSMYE